MPPVNIHRHKHSSSNSNSSSQFIWLSTHIHTAAHGSCRMNANVRVRAMSDMGWWVYIGRTLADQHTHTHFHSMLLLFPSKAKSCLRNCRACILFGATFKCFTVSLKATMWVISSAMCVCVRADTDTLRSFYKFKLQVLLDSSRLRSIWICVCRVCFCLLWPMTHRLIIVHI